MLFPFGLVEIAKPASGEADGLIGSPIFNSASAKGL